MIRCVWIGSEILIVNWWLFPGRLLSQAFLRPLSCAGVPTFWSWIYIPFLRFYLLYIKIVHPPLFEQNDLSTHSLRSSIEQVLYLLAQWTGISTMVFYMTNIFQVNTCTTISICYNLFVYFQLCHCLKYFIILICNSQQCFAIIFSKPKNISQYYLLKCYS